MRHQEGFTLLEVMVVVVIVGIMATFAVISIGSRSLDERLSIEARRLQELFAAATDEAVLQGVELGFVQTRDGYEFVLLKDGKWVPADEGPLRPRPVAEPFFLSLVVEGRRVAPYVPDQKVELKPQVLVLSSGENTEFALEIRARDFAPHYLVKGDVLGRVTMERKES